MKTLNIMNFIFNYLIKNAAKIVMYIFVALVIIGALLMAYHIAAGHFGTYD